jgi:hypothetical protein
MEKFNVAADEEPAFATVALDPAAPVVTDPIAIVAAVPVGPVDPVVPRSPDLLKSTKRSSPAEKMPPAFAT